MPRRRNVRSRRSKRRPRRRMSRRRPRRVRRGGGAGRGGVIRVINQERDRRVTISKTLVSTFIINTAYAGTFNTFWKFDPSGAQGTSQGTPSIAALAPINDWNNYITTYQRYRVNYIKLYFRVTSTVDAPGLWPLMFSRYMYDADFAPPTIVSGLQEKSNMTMIQFTAEKPTYSVKLYPRVQQGVDFWSTTTGLPRGYEPTKMRFTDCTRPVQLFGFAYSIRMNAGFALDVDQEYNITFRSSR